MMAGYRMRSPRVYSGRVRRGARWPRVAATYAITYALMLRPSAMALAAAADLVAARAAETPHTYCLEAIHETGDAHAHDGGGLNLFEEGWYVAHMGTEPGRVLRVLKPGDTVRVDGIEVDITGVEAYERGRERETVESLPDGEVCFQTCVDASGNGRISHGVSRGLRGDGAEPNAVADRLLVELLNNHLDYVDGPEGLQAEGEGRAR